MGCKNRGDKTWQVRQERGKYGRFDGREKRTFAERTQVFASDKTLRKYFLVYEGSETEAICDEGPGICAYETERAGHAVKCAKGAAGRTEPGFGRPGGRGQRCNVKAGEIHHSTSYGHSGNFFRQ